MEISNPVSPGPANPDDSWTCQRCGWVYPNAHPSAKHRRNHKKQCGKIKGSELPPELQKGGSSDEVSSGDDSHGKKDIVHPLSTSSEASGVGLAVEHPNVPESRNLLATEANGSNRVHTNIPLPESVSAPLDAKPEVIDRESTGDVVSIDESPTPESKPNNVLLDSPLPTGDSAPLDAQPEATHLESKRDIIDTDAVKTDASAPEPKPSNVFMDHTSMPGEEGKRDMKPEELPIDLATDEAITPVEKHAKPHASVDSVLAAERGLPELDSDQAKKAENKDEKSEHFSPKHTDTIVSGEEFSNYPRSESKTTLTPPVSSVETNAHETRGLDSDHVTLKGRSLISKEEGLSRQGSSQGDDSWTCRRCGWVYPNPHPSAKHRKKHKKKCGTIKGFPLRTGLHNGGSSDEVSSSDEEFHVKKGHTLDQATQILQSRELGNETRAPESIPSSTNHPPIIAEGEINAESGSNSLQPKESNTLKGDASDGELRNTLDVKDISSPDIIPSNVPVLPDNVPSLDQQNLPAAIGHESFKSSEIQSPLPGKDDTLPNKVSGDLGKESQHGLSREGAPMVADIPVISDLKSSDPSTSDVQSSSGFYSSEPSLPEDKGAGILKVDEPNALISNMDQGGTALSNEALDASAGEGFNQRVIGKKETDVSEKPGFCGLDSVSDLTASDDTMVGNPPRKETGDSLTGGLDSWSEPEKYDSSSQILPADEVPVENKSVTENLLPPIAESAAVVTGLAQDAERDGKFPNMEPPVSSVEHAPKNEPSAQIVEGGNDGAFSSSAGKVGETSPTPKIDETSPVPNWEHPSDKQIAPGVVTGLAADPVQLVPKNESSAQIVEGGNADARPPTVEKIDETRPPTVEKIDETRPVPEQEHSLDNQVASAQAAEQEVTGEGTSIQRSLDGSAFKNVSSVSEDPGQVGDTQNTNTTSGIPEDTTGVAAVAKDKEPGGSSSVQENREDKSEAGGAPEAIVEPEAKEETSRGLGSSDLNNAETHNFPRSESAVTASSELGGSSHKLSDSLEIFEDAQDTLETCSVGGSVDENEGLDESRQASGRIQEPKPLEAGSLDVMEPEKSIVLLQNPTVLSSSSSVESKESSSEEKAPTFPGTSYGARTESGDLKAPSPEAWQEPGPSNTKIEGKKPSTSEVTEDSRSGDSHTALRSLMAKEVPEKEKPNVETSTAAEDLKSPMKKDGSSATAYGKKTKSRSFWRFCVCCSTVQ